MANTNTLTTLVTGKRSSIIYVCIDSDGAEETDLVIYDSSAIATTLGLADTLKSTILQVWCTSNSKLGVFHLEWDATTDVLALALPNEQPIHLDFRPFGGLKNTAGTGVTGDITFTSTGFAAGDKLTFILEVSTN